jgi:hypothetical protein
VPWEQQEFLALEPSAQRERPELLVPVRREFRRLVLPAQPARLAER